jgi:hypothetical protein
MTTMTTEREPRYVVLVRPKGVGPSYWRSMDGRKICGRSEVINGQEVTIGDPVGPVILFAWQTATESGGWTLGVDPAHAVSGDVELGRRIEDWYEEHEGEPWPWEFRQVRLPD